MNCLSWWLPLFLIPAPACPPEILVLFLIVYALKTRPCVYCGLIIVGSFVATQCWSRLSPCQPTRDPSRLLHVGLPGFQTGFDLDLGWSWR